jgi:hypothetical protein
MQEIQAQQGTRLSDTPPWMSYDRELDQKLSPRLAEAVEEYAQHHHEESNSSQAKEELHRQRELNAQVAKEYQWLTPEQYADVEARIGRVLDYGEFISKLRKLGWDANAMFWYREHPHRDKLTLLHGNYFGTEDPKVACWVQYGYMPEFSIMRFDEHGVPLDERRRGWRTCLLQLILKGILTEDLVDREFGKATGPASERYNSTLYAWRKQRF